MAVAPITHLQPCAVHHLEHMEKPLVCLSHQISQAIVLFAPYEYR